MITYLETFVMNNLKGSDSFTLVYLSNFNCYMPRTVYFICIDNQFYDFSIII